MKKGKWSGRAAIVARWFGVTRDDLSRATTAAAASTPRIALSAGKIVLIAGASGAGKSTLLRRVRRAHCRHRGRRWIELGGIRLRDLTVIDLIVDPLGGGSEEGAIVEGLELLSRVGLSEVWTYLRRPCELSEGQRWRLRLAVALARARGDPGSELPGLSREASGLVAIAADEFCAALDRVTALVVARALRRAVESHGNLCAVVASGHEDLVGALSPDVIVRCDFGEYEVVDYVRGRKFEWRNVSAGEAR
jgi:ABC-type ATPase with predicted acetyltransferase domain